MCGRLRPSPTRRTGRLREDRRKNTGPVTQGEPWTPVRAPCVTCVLKRWGWSDGGTEGSNGKRRQHCLRSLGLTLQTSRGAVLPAKRVRRGTGRRGRASTLAGPRA